MSLGKELQDFRREKNVSVREVADGTHLQTRVITAIEEDRFDRLPGGMFKRAYVKMYANFIGFDLDRAMLLFDEQVTDTETPTEEVVKEDRSLYIALILVLLGLSIVGVGFLIFRR